MSLADIKRLEKTIAELTARLATVECTCKTAGCCEAAPAAPAPVDVAALEATISAKLAAELGSKLSAKLAELVAKEVALLKEAAAALVAEAEPVPEPEA
jgi:hypothetical protein